MTTYPIITYPYGVNKQGKTNDSTVIRALAHQNVNLFLAVGNSGIADLTDSSTGVASGAYVLTAANVAVTDTAVSGTNLATKANVDTGLSNVQDALNELFTKANAYAAKLGLPQVIYNGGGAAPDGTVNAILTSTTAATTGPTSASLNPLVAALNNALYDVAVLSNTIAKATMKTKLTVYRGTWAATVPALVTTTSAAGAPGVAKVDADAVLAQLAANVATVAKHLNTLNDGLTTLLVVPQ